MNTVYVIGDTHFGHHKAITFRPYATIEEHDRDLVARWNSVVRKDDTVWHLGDVLFGGNTGHAILGELKGIKKLVAGNHDHYPTEMYLRYFRRVLGAAELHNCLLTHIPVHESQFGRYRANIHGHLHSQALDDPRYICVSAERINYTPVPLASVIPLLHEQNRQTASQDQPSGA